ncbi:MAG: hypothetical protein K2L98_01905, partial [Bacilli bacterium]|nr:hypothetical protein [Bacilli bacterium]
CISCGNELPEGTTSCPFCGNTVLPTNHNVVNANAQNDTGVPVTPDTPVLPQDQNLVLESETTSLENEVNQEAAMPNGGDVSSLNDENTLQDAVLTNQEPVNPMAASEGVPAMPGAGLGVQPPDMGVQTITNQGEIVDGMKIASTAAPVIENKKKKKVIIVVAVIVAIIAIAAGIGVYYYMSQYKSADKRIDAVFSGMNKFAAGLKAEKVETKSGTYDIGVSFSYGDTSIDCKVDGKYAYDLEKRIMDYTFNISKLDMKMDGEELNLIDKDPLKVELYMAEAKAYVLLENFYENYIYSDVEEYDKLFDGIEQNDINYTLILQGYINAFKAGLKAASNTQTVKEVTLDGKQQKANVVTIILNKANKKLIVETAVNSIKNNTKLLEEYAKLSNTTVDELKKDIEDSTKDMEFSDDSATLEIITNTKGSLLLGIRAYDDKANIELTQVVNGFKLSYKEDKKDVFNVIYSSTSTINSTVKETSQKIEFTGYDDDNKLIKINIETTLKDDVNPKVEKINTKNSVSANNISAADQQKILENMYNFGNLGMLLQSSLGSVMEASVEKSDEIISQGPVVSQQPDYSTIS